MTPFCSMSLEALTAWLVERGQPAFRAKQLFEWVYKKGICEWSQMTSLPKELQGILKEHFLLPSLEFVKEVGSLDGQTFKSLWKLTDGQLVESVLICAPGRQTVCVSSQVGCPARCAFCASGKEGLMRNLSSGEIVEQVWHTSNKLRTIGQEVTNVVFMGMGEPLENYDAVVGAVRLLNEPQGINMSRRRITISTVGVVEKIIALSHEDLGVNLVLSLHAPNQRIRQKIIPYARRYDLTDVMQAMDDFAERTKRDITFEYTLLEGINDQVEHAHELAQLIGSRQCTVNLIPYNPVMGLRLKRPSRQSIEEFRSVLEQRGLIHTCRYTKGDDIAAACGQLRLQKQGEVNDVVA